MSDLPEDGTHTDRREQGGQIQFRAISRDVHGSIVSVRVFYTDTQFAATIIARKMVDGRPIELWGERGLIHRYGVKGDVGRNRPLSGPFPNPNETPP